MRTEAMTGKMGSWKARIFSSSPGMSTATETKRKDPPSLSSLTRDDSDPVRSKPSQAVESLRSFMRAAVDAAVGDTYKVVLSKIGEQLKPFLAPCYGLSGVLSSDKSMPGINSTQRGSSCRIR
jgi:hypothetical protein